MFDYKEGNLSGAELQEFENFLIQHPEFEMEADAWEMASVENQAFVYPHTAQLEKDNRIAGFYGWGAAAVLLLLVGASSLVFLYTGETAIEGTSSNSVLIGETASNPAVYPYAENTKTNRLNELSAVASNDWSVYSRNAVGNNSSVQGTQNDPFNQRGTLNNSQGTSTQGTSGQGTSSPFATNGTRYSENRSDFGTMDQKGANGLSRSLAQEEGKFDREGFSGSYVGNPEEKDLTFDVSKKPKPNYNSLKHRMKRFYRSIEKQMGYPVALKNLRDPQLTFPQNTLLAHNAGFTGGMLAPRFEMNYRNQWASSELSSQTMNLSYDSYVKSLRGGFGLMVGATDVGNGAYNDVNINLLYSPKISLGKNAVLEPAIKMTMGVISTNEEKLTGIDAMEINRGRIINTVGANPALGLQRQWYKDWGLGVVLNTKWFYAGFNADNLSGHYENTFSGDGFEPQRAAVMKTAIIGSDWEDKDLKMGLSPFIAWENQDRRNEFWAGATYRLHWITVGGAYSTNKEWTASAGIKFKRFKLSYQYDMTSSLLQPEGGLIGSHNIGIRFNAPPNSRVKKISRR